MILAQEDLHTDPDAATLRDALRTVIDPEAGMNIVDLGLVYRVAVDARAVAVDVTMTSAACPLGEMIVAEVRATLESVLPADFTCAVNLVWSPPWSPE
ncbi:MAG: metal-sulfur cluster assembly factor, partial [Rhodocyclales bacterium]|nr:metal-sulfur cluster assembly factor [Rhodocyclales bacterium]